MNHRRFKVFLSVAFLLYCPQAISQDLNPSILFHKAKSQIQRQTLEQRIYVHRSVAVPFADSIKTLADTLTVFHKEDFKPKNGLLSIIPSTFKNASLREALVPVPDSKHLKILNTTKQLYSISLALEKDLKRFHGHQFVLATSHTLEEFGRLGLEYLPDIIDYLEKTKRIKNTYPEKFPRSTFGTVELIKGLARNIGAGRADTETVTLYSDAVVELTWGLLGYFASGGNMKVASTFQTIGGLSARLGRQISVGYFRKLYGKHNKIDEALIENWEQSQRVKISHLGDKADIETIEEYYDYDQRLLSYLSRKQKRQANLTFNLTDRSRVQARRTIRFHQFHYRELCAAGYCRILPLPQKKRLVTNECSNAEGVPCENNNKNSQDREIADNRLQLPAHVIHVKCSDGSDFPCITSSIASSSASFLCKDGSSPPCDEPPGKEGSDDDHKCDDGTDPPCDPPPGSEGVIDVGDVDDAHSCSDGSSPPCKKTPRRVSISGGGGGGPRTCPDGSKPPCKERQSSQNDNKKTKADATFLRYDFEAKDSIVPFLFYQPKRSESVLISK